MERKERYKRLLIGVTCENKNGGLNSAFKIKFLPVSLFIYFRSWEQNANNLNVLNFECNLRNSKCIRVPRNRCFLREKECTAFCVCMIKIYLLCNIVMSNASLASLFQTLLIILGLIYGSGKILLDFPSGISQ